LKNIFFDTDVILDISIKRDMDVKDSVKLLNSVEKGLYRGFTSSIIFSNTYYIQRKFIGHDRSIIFLKKLRVLLTVLNVNDQIIQKALESEFNDFEDAIQYFTALENKIDFIITRNVADYKNSVIPVYTPSELLNIIDIDKGNGT
jgi:predicted nucleic acid-binding protein